MGSANRVPIWNTGYNASVVRRVVLVSGLTGFAITSLRSHNLMEPVDRLELDLQSLPGFTSQGWGHGELGTPRREP